MKWKNLLILLGAVLILVLVVVGRPYLCPLPPEAPDVHLEPAEVETGPQVGKLAPDFTLPNALTGKDILLSDFRGRPVLLNFWTTWCPACRAEKPHLIAAYNDFADQGLVMLGVNIRESPSLVIEYVIQKGIPFSVLLDTAGEVANLYRVRGIPTTFLIDRQGIIQEVRIGPFRSAADVAASVEKIIERSGVRP
jgi:peroxiredoxin